MLFVLSSMPKGLSVRWLTKLDSLVSKRFHPQGNISVVFVSEHEIRRLNALYRGKDAATDVLSFRLSSEDTSSAEPQYSSEKIFGEIIFCEKLLRRHARERSNTFEDEFRAMLIHATLHLVGYDHEKAHDAKSMEAMERLLGVAVRKNLGKSADFQYTKGIRRKVKKRDSSG